jgi:hypothetical protein
MPMLVTPPIVILPSIFLCPVITSPNLLSLVKGKHVAYGILTARERCGVGRTIGFLSVALV